MRCTRPAVSAGFESLIKSGRLRPLDKRQLRNLKNIDTAYLDPAFDPGNRYSVPYAVGSGNPNRDAMRHIDPAIAANQAVFPPPAVQRRLEMLRDLDRTQRRVLSRMWTEIKVR